ncbi:MAG: hypothetical protein RR912_03715 [Clostridium sp.]
MLINKTNTVTFTPKKMNGYIEIPTIWSFDIIYGSLATSNIEIPERNDKYIKIKGIGSQGTFTIKYTEISTSKDGEEVITLKGVY